MIHQSIEKIAYCALRNLLIGRKVIGFSVKIFSSGRFEARKHVKTQTCSLPCIDNYRTCSQTHVGPLTNSHWQQCPSNYRASCQATEVAWQCVPMVTFSAFVNMVRGEERGEVRANLCCGFSSLFLREAALTRLLAVWGQPAAPLVELRCGFWHGSQPGSALALHSIVASFLTSRWPPWYKCSYGLAQGSEFCLFGVISAAVRFVTGPTFFFFFKLLFKGYHSCLPWTL